jgi:hypothetical protein
MAAPNLTGITSIIGKTATLAATTAATAIVDNPAASGEVLKINSLIIANVDGTSACNVTVDHYRGTTATHTHYLIAVPARASFVAIERGNGLYLEEGDSLRITASADGDLEAVCSYEAIA